MRTGLPTPGVLARDTLGSGAWNRRANFGRNCSVCQFSLQLQMHAECVVEIGHHLWWHATDHWTDPFDGD